MSWIKNTITIIISLSLSLMVAELMVRSFYPQNLSGSWTVIDDYGLRMNKSEGESIHAHGDRKVIYSFEDFGIRSSFQPIEQPAIKVLVLGDSFTVGYLLSVEDTYVDQLARANNNMKFFNAATGGWGASDYTAYMETYCKRINPDIALVIMNTDDIGRMHRSALYNYKIESDSINRSEYIPTLKNRVKKLLNSFSFYQVLLERSHLLQLVRTAYVGRLSKPLGTGVRSFGLMNIEDVKYSNRFSAALFSHLQRISSECGSELRVVYTGVQEKNSDGVYPTLEFLDFAKQSNFFEQLNVRFIDLTDTLQMKEYRSQLTENIIVGDGHPNERVAKLLFEAIQQSKILSN